MVRAFKYFTIASGGTPQPLIGTTTTAAIGPVSVPPGTPVKPILVIPVTDGSMFLGADWVILGKPSTGEERLYVLSVSGNNVTVKLPDGGLTGIYASGAYFRLALNINSTYVQTKDGNAGPIYLGTLDTMVKATFAFCIAKLFQVPVGTQPTEYRDGRSGLQNPDDCGQIWVDGTTSDSYAPSIGKV